MKKLIFLLFVVSALQSCSDKMTADSVKNTKWLLSEWPSQTLPIGKEATLTFDAENKVGGKSFCNGYGGNALIQGSAVKFDQLFGTMMFCEEIGQAEKIYLDGLKATTSFKIANGKLHLFNNGQLIMVFTKTE